ncbi:mCG144644, partial [Mus musculus]
KAPRAASLMPKRTARNRKPEFCFSHVNLQETTKLGNKTSQKPKPGQATKAEHDEQRKYLARLMKTSRGAVQAAGGSTGPALDYFSRPVLPALHGV